MQDRGDDEAEYLTVPQVAAWAQLSTCYVRRLIRRAALPACRTSARGPYRVHRDDLALLLVPARPPRDRATEGGRP